MTTSLTLNQALDQSVERLGPLHKRVLKRRLQIPSYRTRLLDDLAVQLHADPACASLQAAEGPVTTLLASGDGETLYTFDPDNLVKFLDLIIKYLPQLIAILIPFFTSLLLPFLLVLTASTASAQTYAPPLPLQRIEARPRLASILERMAQRQQARQASRQAYYQSVSGNYSGGGSTGSYQMLSGGSTGTVSGGSTGNYSAPTLCVNCQASYSAPTPSYSTAPTPVYSAPYSTPAPVSYEYSAPIPCLNCPVPTQTYSTAPSSYVESYQSVPVIPSVPYVVPTAPAPTLIPFAPFKNIRPCPNCRLKTTTTLPDTPAKYVGWNVITNPSLIN